MTEPERNKVFIATPTINGNVCGTYANALMRLIGSQVSFDILCGHRVYQSDVVRARSWLVADMLETDATHLLFIDADVDFTPAMIEGMLISKKSFVCCPYPKKRPGPSSIYPGTFLGPHPEIDAETACVEIAGFGLGMTLLSRGMLEKMVEEYAWTQTFGDFRKGEGVYSKSVALFNLVIEPVVGPDGQPSATLHSEDYSFSYRYRKMGGRCWLYLGAGVCGHTGTMRFSGKVEDFNPLLAQAGAVATKQEAAQ